MPNGKRVAILGGGPSALFVLKRWVEASRKDYALTIFEKNKVLGAGMPYSKDGANPEHITNVSGNEIPELVSSLADWMADAPPEKLKRFGIESERFNEYKVVPRLIFGEYLSSQFTLLLDRAKKDDLTVTVHLSAHVMDVRDNQHAHEVSVVLADGRPFHFDHVIICTGHCWPSTNEHRTPGYFDSPYPPSKLQLKRNHPVAIRGASLSAIDAIRTLARSNGNFVYDDDGRVSYTLAEGSEDFKMVMHSRNGLLPAVRFHLEDSHFSRESILTAEQVKANREQNDGFLSLDYVFDETFKKPLRDKDPEFHKRIQDMRIEEFVNAMMETREKVEPFTFFKAEYAEAEKSIRRRESVYWKEMLAVLSFAMNYPAKYLSAEDMMRLQRVLMPLISIVIAYVPQSSCQELIALHEAGILSLVAVGEDGHFEPFNIGAHFRYTSDGETHHVHYQTFVDCIGQRHLSFEQFPFKTLLDAGSISPARIRFRSPGAGERALLDNSGQVSRDEKGQYHLTVSGIAINDKFQVLDGYGALNDRIYVMAVPFIGGYNPDYSGLDFCETVSLIIINTLLSNDTLT